MKKLLLILLIIVVKTASAQTEPTDTTGLNIPPLKDGHIAYEKVFEAPNNTKDQLYDKAKDYLTTLLKKQKQIEYKDDRTNSVLILNNVILKFKARGGYLGMNGFDHKDQLTIQLDFKDNKYRCRITKMVIINDYGPASQNPLEDFELKLLGNNISVDYAKPKRLRDVILVNAKLVTDFIDSFNANVNPPVKVRPKSDDF